MYLIDSMKMSYSSEQQEHKKYRVDVIFKEVGSGKRLFARKWGGREVLDTWTMLVDGRHIKYERKLIDEQFDEVSEV